MIGTTLGHYRILDKLGQGGMGEVFLALDTKLDRQVALKILRSESADLEDRLRRFQREARAVAALNHPNIVTIYSVEEADGLHFLTMEYVEGKTLSKLIPKNGLELERFFELSIPLADALSAAHERGVIHRDLKPGNVMVGRDGRVRVLDFGLAKLRPFNTGHQSPVGTEEPTEELTAEGRIVGTTPYMSPEQLKGDHVDPRADIFALGVVLYQMATGRHPFSKESSAEVISAILSETPPPVTEVNARLPRHLGRVIRHCLEKDPNQRLQTALDAKNELVELQEEVLKGEAVSSSESLFPVQPRARARPWLWVGLAVAVLVLLIAGYQIGKRPPPIGSDLTFLAVMPFANLTGDPELTYVSDGLSAGILNKVSGLGGLQVVSRAEAWSYRDQGLSPRQLGTRLGVGGVVDGDLQRDGEKLRASVNLTDAETGFLLWSHPYSTEKGNIFDLQNAIADDLATFLSIPLTAKERRRLARDPTASSQAYASYVRGQRFLDDLDNPQAPSWAADNFRQALRLDPEFALAHVGLSEALWRMYHHDLEPELLDQAGSEAELALKQDPDLPAARVALARVYRSTGRHAASIEALEDALAGHPHPDQAYRELATSYERIGDFDEAERCLQAAVALDDTDWSNWNSLGVFLSGQGRYGDARRAFRKASEQAPPGVYRPLENQGTMSLYEGDFAGAIEIYEQIPGPPPYAVLASNMATAYYFLGDITKAARYFHLAVELDPKDAELRRNLGDVLLRQGLDSEAREQYLEAVALMDAELAISPGDLELVRRRTMYAAKAGQCENALAEGRRLASVLPETADNTWDLAYVFALCGDREEALAAVRAAIDAGVSPAALGEEDEFAALRNDPEFLALTNSQTAGD